MELVPGLPEVIELTTRAGLLVGRDGRNCRRPSGYRSRTRRCRRRGGRQRRVVRCGRQWDMHRPRLRREGGVGKLVPSAAGGRARLARQGQTAPADNHAGEGDPGGVDRRCGGPTMPSSHKWVLFSLLVPASGARELSCRVRPGSPDQPSPNDVNASWVLRHILALPVDSGQQIVESN